MKAHTSEFKNNLKNLGKQINSRVTYGNVILGEDDLCSINPITNTNLLKSNMQELDFESYTQVPSDVVINYQFGLLVNGTYEYIDYGYYIVYSSEYNEDTKTYDHVCYDSMLLSMKEYKNLQHGTFPMTIREYLTNLCLDIGLIFDNSDMVFANYDKIIPSDLYANLGYTYRDIFDELSQVTASNICINSDNRVEIRYINQTNDTIDEEYLKDINVKFGEKYGPINSIVLSRSAESDNVFLKDDESVENNGLCEIKIINNQIMNDNNRSEFLPDILERLDGLEYYINDFSSTGIVYYDVCDKYNIQIGENTYQCVLFNDELKVNSGISENIYTEMPEQSETDYKKADKTDLKINQLYIIADKQKGEINLVASKQMDTSNEIVRVGTVTLDNCLATNMYKLSIKGDLNRQYHMVNQDNSTYPVYLDTYLTVVSGDNIDRYKLPIDYLTHLNNVYDEFLVEDGYAKLIQRIGIENNEKYVLPIPVVTDLGEFNIPLYDDTNTVSLESFSTVTLDIKYLIKTAYTEEMGRINESLQSEINVRSNEVQILSQTQTNLGENLQSEITTRADQVQILTQSQNTLGENLQSEITTRAGEIQLLSSSKVGNDEIIAKINLTPEQAKILANKIEISANDVLDLLAGNTINLTSKNIVISSDNFNVDASGNATMNNANVNGTITTNNGNIAGWSISNGFLKSSDEKIGFASSTWPGDPVIWAGNVSPYGRPGWPSNTPFYVTNQGLLHATNADISGTINGSDIKGSTFKGNNENSIYVEIGTDAIDTVLPTNNSFVIKRQDGSKMLTIGGRYWSSPSTKQIVVYTPANFLSLVNDDSTYGVHFTAGTVEATYKMRSPEYVNTSLAELKKNIDNFNCGLELIKNTDIYTYHYKTQDDKDKKHIGVVIGKEYNTPIEILSGDNEGVDLYSMISVCLQAIKEQQSQIELLKQEIEILKLERNDS